jgi:hypothetical protein
MRKNHNTNIRPTVRHFALGQTFITPGAEEALMIAGQTELEFLRQHMSGNWGDLSEEDIQENEFALEKGFRLLSAYRTAKGQKLYGSLPKRIAAPRQFYCLRNTETEAIEKSSAGVTTTRAAYTVTHTIFKERIRCQNRVQVFARPEQTRLSAISTN